MNIFKNTGIDCFAVQHESLSRIRQFGKPKLKQAALKLYLFLCSRNSKGPVEADAGKIEKSTGLTKNALPRARNELDRLKLIHVDKQTGQGGTFTYGVLNLKTERIFHPKENNGAAYFQVPTITLHHDALMRDKKASIVVYTSILAEANRLSTSHLALSPMELAGSADKLRDVLPALTTGDVALIKVTERNVEVLDPYTGNSLNAKKQDTDSYWHLNPQGKRISVDKLLTPENFIIYYTAELPDLQPSLVQQDVRCQFHSDSKASMSVNLDKGIWKCHACGDGGGIREYEMKKLDAKDPAEAWRSICRKFGVRFIGKKRGAVVTEHIYKDEDGNPVSKLKRYEDGSGSWHHFLDGKWKLGAGGRKRIPYNLPDLRAADVAIITEGEKKADLVSLVGLQDIKGKSVAVTCTGSANSWKAEVVEHFRGKMVIVFPDSDEPGQRYGQMVTGSLTSAGIETCSVDFSSYGNDVRDFLKDHSRDELLEHINSPWLEVPQSLAVSTVDPHLDI